MHLRIISAESDNITDRKLCQADFVRKHMWPSMGKRRGLSNTPKLSPIDEDRQQPDSPEVSSWET